MARTWDLREMCVTDSSAARPVKAFGSELTWIAFIAGALVGLLGTVFCLLETRYSWSVISWQRKFKHDLTEKGEVRLADLVNFQWERIYIIDPYEQMFPDDNAHIFPKTSSLDPFWWKNIPDYWTIAYTRPNRPPFLIKIETKEWGTSNWKHHMSSDHNAKLRLITPKTIEATWCSSLIARCLALDDIRSKVPTEPRH
jgi:hypothetical protein